MIAVGYDAYGNKIGPLQSATWTTDGTLHSIDKPIGSRIFYQSDQVTHTETGLITASSNNSKEVKIKGTTYVKIAGPSNSIVSAITRDENGSGFLDRIDVQLYSPATIPVKGAQITFTGTYDDPVTGARNITYTTYLTVDRVVSHNGTGTDSLFSVYLVEPTPGSTAYNYPQTGWTPTITISGVETMPMNGPTTDGAGPVVWSVVKTISTNTSDRSKDVVTVTFSEPVKSGVNDFSLSNSPKSILRVWTINGTDTSEVTNMLDSIPAFTLIDQTKTTVTFSMSNKHDLTSRDWIDIVWGDSTKRITDNRTTSPNAPAQDNRLVQVIVKGLKVDEIKVVPNPTGPIFTHENPGVMNLAYQPNARNWVRNDGAGAVLTFNIAPSINPVTHLPEKVTGYLKIYDMIGNVVVEAVNDTSNGLLPASWADSSQHPFDMYWNGSNSKGMRVAPGIYRAFLFLKYQDSAKPRKYIGTIGITR
jgi:hypothetical protein